MKRTKLPKVLSLAIRKYKPLRKDINLFKEELTNYLNHIAIAEEKGEHEENFKKYLADFLKNSLYQEHLINTKERIDLAIYSGKDANSHISVLIEVKRPSNVNEFLTEKNINKKALQELLLYYLRERVDNKNNNIKQLIATNGYEWYLFKGEDFYNYFYKNPKLIKEYKAFRDGEKDSSKNELFYKEIAAKYIAELGDTLDYVYFNVKDFESYLPLENKTDAKLVTLYKFLSSTHLLNKTLGNDNNQLNKQFYGELLHIIGLEEHKDKGKKIIRRLPEGKRHYGSLLESAIFTLEDRDYLRKVPNLRNYGSTKEEQLFSVGLELCLTWINRVLFIKLLEAQLFDYHNKDKKYRFLNSDFIKGFDDLEALFFSALAKKHEERSSRYQDKYQFVPYLNSSLFEPNELEDTTMQVSNIKDEDIQLYDKTILKDHNLKRLTGEKNTLFYLFDFLDAYDFSADNGEQVQEGEQSKALISASVLGLIFEKINGYKDGSFYTPSYITMYMSKETLRRAVVQKINTHFDWKCTDFEDLKEDLKDYIKEQGKERKKARLAINQVINSLRICDPAVGSGHFLVSCLNELIAIKSELKVLCDDQGERLEAYIHIDNDELIIEDEEDNLFTYSPTVARTHSIQKALFHEKQTLIENCLFAVDINPNSVKICRLRLWIELLKNAYYNKENRLQTLPNIDINIKCGNSLISRFGLEDDLKGAFKSKENPYSLKDYKNAVQEYKQTNDKTRKREIQTIIDTIKSAFTDTLDKKFIKKLATARGKYELKNQELTNLKAFGTKIPKKEKDLLKKLKKAFEKADSQKEEILNNAIYQNAFEWRFEFPEVLDNKGNFVGFDVVIGNPPYILLEGKNRDDFAINYFLAHYNVASYKIDLYHLFFEKSITLLSIKGRLNFITPSNFLMNKGLKSLRKYILDNTIIDNILLINGQIFAEASVDTCISHFSKSKQIKNEELVTVDWNNNKFTQIEKLTFQRELVSSDELNVFLLKETITTKNTILLEDICNVNFGMQVRNRKIFTTDLIKKPKKTDISSLHKPCYIGKDITKYLMNWSENYIYTGLEAKNGGCWDFAAHTSNPKILVRQIGETPRCAIDYNGFHCINAMFMIVFKTQPFIFSYEVLLAILNSKFVAYYWSMNFSDGRKTFPKIKGGFLKRIPIPKEVSINTEKKVADKVKETLVAKEADPQVDTTTLEQEIDVMVYKLYGLTYAEVLVVEEGFAMPQEAYDSYELEG